MTASIAALVLASIGYATLSAESGRGACYNVAPFCSDSCSCGSMRCTASCDDGCADWFEDQDGDYTVWCEDIM